MTFAELRKIIDRACTDATKNRLVVVEVNGDLWPVVTLNVLDEKIVIQVADGS